MAIVDRKSSALPERTLDGFLGGLPYERLLPALRSVNVAPFDKLILDIGI